MGFKNPLRLCILVAVLLGEWTHNWLDVRVLENGITNEASKRIKYSVLGFKLCTDLNVSKYSEAQ